MTKTLTGSALAAALYLVTTPAIATAADGKSVFLAQKCEMCHSVKSAGIEGPKRKGVVDLSGISSKRKAEWIKAYLEKAEKLDGKAHPPKFKGSTAELKALVEWLMSLKPAS